MAKRRKATKSKQDKIRLKRAALFAWSHAIQLAAENACSAVGGFDKTRGSSTRFICVVHKMRAFIKQLNEIAQAGVCTDEEQEARLARLRAEAGPSGARRLRLAAEAEYYCSNDDDCPDGQICVRGTCESPFP